MQFIQFHITYLVKLGKYETFSNQYELSKLSQPIHYDPT